jgi:hypothetical protein
LPGGSLRYVNRDATPAPDPGLRLLVDLWLIVLVALACLAVGVVVFRQRRQAIRREQRERAIAEFAPLIPTLEGSFLAAATATGKPRGLKWERAVLAAPPVFAADRVTDELYAFVAATVSFSAIEGGGMEEVEAVSNLRAATAVFVHRGGQWTTDGRVVFNFDPAAAVAHYVETLAPVTVE